MAGLLSVGEHFQFRCESIPMPLRLSYVVSSMVSREHTEPVEDGKGIESVVKWKRNNTVLVVVGGWAGRERSPLVLSCCLSGVVCILSSVNNDPLEGEKRTK